LKAVLVDDQLENRLQLRSLLLEHWPELEIVGEAGSVTEAQLLLINTSTDILFLDVEMGDGTGFDLLSRLTDYHFMVVFVTAFEKYAVKAFKTNAVDYLLKPVSTDELKLAVDKLKQWHVVLNRDSAVRSVYKKAVQNAVIQAEEKNIPNQLVISSHQGLEVVHAQQIKYVEADNTYSHFHMDDGRVVTSSKPILEYEELLDTELFFRVHRTYLVNINFIEKFSQKENQAILQDGSILPVSRRKSAVFSEFLKKLPN